MNSNTKFNFECKQNENRLAVHITALEKVALYDLADAIYDECFGQSGSCYHQCQQDTDFEVRFTPFGGAESYSFIQHCLWLNPTTILSDISRQFMI